MVSRPNSGTARLVLKLPEGARLTHDDIVGSFRKEKTRLKLSHLEVTKDFYGTLSCGDNPHFHAKEKDA